MNKNTVKRLAAWILLFSVMLCGCGKEQSKRPQLNADFSGREKSAFSFSAQPSEIVTLSPESAERVTEVISQQKNEYPYAELYALDEVKKHLTFDTDVESHRYSALDENGMLSAEGLYRKVQENNEAFMADEPFGYTYVEDDYIAQLCEFIVCAVDAMRQKYPDVDWSRVYCNLGNLKILYDVGMLSFAEVSADMVLSISKNNTEIILNIKGEDGFSRVLTHETMHMIQLGCACEGIENCTRRAGIALYWEDFPLNTTDWTWMVEGSAERLMCSLTGGDAVTYQYKMDYLCSMTMSILLREDVAADTMETMSLHSDPQRLFDAFGCETQQERDELLNMMITLQVLQMQPKNFHIMYKEKTGIDLQADEDAMNRFSYSLKPAVCISMAKEFYENLVAFMLENPLPYNDLFFLINLFEGHLNQHLTYADESKAEVNQPFFSSYTAMREALFTTLEADNPSVDVTALYDAYEITAGGENLLNAELSMLHAEKLAFLAERAQWQSELLGLGKKVP